MLFVIFLGGGFMLGDSVIYGPNRLLAHDVILVVPHYRLGALGKYHGENDDDATSIIYELSLDNAYGLWLHRFPVDARQRRTWKHGFERSSTGSALGQ